MSKLISVGHSFGGASSLAISAADDRIKACVAMDPMTSVDCDVIKEGGYQFDKPLLILHSESYGLFKMMQEWTGQDMEEIL